MNFETALTFARKIDQAESLEQAKELATVIVEQIEEVLAKIERHRAKAA